MLYSVASTFEYQGGKMRHHFLAPTLLLTVGTSAVPASPRTESPIINLGYAKYNGLRNETYGVDKYLGMRYAQAPLKELRFRAPRDPKPVDGIQTAKEVSPRNAALAPNKLTNDFG